MPVDYNNISKKFSDSRKNMKWEEIYYFIDFVQSQSIKNPTILDIGCGNGRVLGELQDNNIIVSNSNYTGIDASSGMIEEANKNFPKGNFLVCDMENTEILGDQKYDYIFFIASFHHLENTQQRLDTLKKTTTILKDGGYICMTNWSLMSKLNKEKYASSAISNSRNVYGGVDFSIKLGKYNRFYHCFSLSELEKLFTKTNLSIIENREFENQRNFISILRK